MRTIGILFVLILISCQPNYVEPECFLIPSGRVGQITIFYNDPNGQKTEHVDKRRIYNIPPTGDLSTQFKFETGIINQIYYYVDLDGNRRQILIDSSQFYYDYPIAKKSFMDRHKNDTLIMAYGITGHSEKKLFQQFIIGTYFSNNSADSTTRH